MRVRNLIAAVTVLALVTGGVALATPGSGITSAPIAVATFAEHVTAAQHGGAQLHLVQQTLAPGGHTGWHSHPGAEVVLVQEGSLTVRSVLGARCWIRTYAAGQGFLMQAQETFIIEESTGTAGARFVAALFDVPPGSPARIDKTDPGACPPA